MQVCNKCNVEKEDEDFNFKNKLKNKRSTICKVCQREYKKKHYHNNKEQYYRRNDEKTERVKKWLQEYKIKIGCKVCKENFPYCLEFHHIDPSTKKYSVARLVRTVTSYTAVQREIDKCVLLCSNCHRKVHYGAIDLNEVK